jgi:hypothetical protein
MIAAMLGVLSLAGCAGGHCALVSKELFTLRKLLAVQTAKIEHLEAQLNDGLTLALCSPELRQLLEDVQKECLVSPDTKAATQCTTTQIRGAVINADPEHRGRFLKLMSHLPHEVLYLQKGSTEALPYRIERLDRMTKPALLQSTVFLVVSSGESGNPEAVRRAELVEAWLLARKIPPHVIRRWIYDFPANRIDIMRPIDLPGLLETKELHRGVWVFRADC